MREIVLATGNVGKIREMQQTLESFGFLVKSQNDFNVPEAIENGLTFVENALIKARNACKHTGLPAIADDSGLEVDALDGSPGIFSARFAGSDASDADNNARLLHELENTEQRSARFQCVIVMLEHEHDPTPIICQGTWEGTILEKPQGENGFGYDPLFYISELDCSSAELEPEHKKTISHRAQALTQLAQKLNLES